MITSSLIKDLLALSYSKNGHAVFKEFRTLTGYSPTKYVDVVAVGLYKATYGIKAFEVKISRGDFLSDVSQFPVKHSDALEISSEFYYVCPWNLIRVDEVPEISGLMYVDSANQLKTVKKAMYREKQFLPFPLFQAFALYFGTKIRIETPLRFLGKDISEEDLDKEVQKKLGYEFDRRVGREVEKRIEEITKNKDRSQILVAQLRNILWYSNTGELTPKLEEEIIQTFRSGHSLKSMISELCSTVLTLQESIKMLGGVE